ncbi:hypothetical protein TCON_0083 [Astathelohania contejeani]|uniref:Uncharacterized protein n=1 Tax=Astathelohania contejeani TaxID=164912 RepID=A0ABQ7I2V1_9MICR|nr:hypothetical protein TCON_0083 [Thelohania contejeani]
MKSFLFLVFLFAGISKHSNIIDTEDKTLSLDYKSVDKYIACDNEDKEKNDSNSETEFMLACHFKKDSDYSNWRNHPSDSKLCVYAIFSKRMISDVMIDNKKKSKLFVPLLPLDGTLILANMPFRFFSVGYQNNNISSSISSYSSKKNNKYYKFKLQSKDELYNEDIKSIFSASSNLLNTLVRHNRTNIDELNFEYLYFKSQRKELKRVKSDLIFLFDHLMTPKYHLYVKIKYMLFLIYELLGKDFDFTGGYKPAPNIFIFFDKYFNKYDRTKIRDETILYAIYRELMDMRYRINVDGFLQYLISKKMYNALEDILNSKEVLNITTLSRWLDSIRELWVEECNTFAGEANLNVLYIFYDVIKSKRIVNFLFTCSEIMYARSRFTVENSINGNHSDYCFMFYKLCDLRPNSIMNSINYASDVTTYINIHKIKPDLISCYKTDVMDQEEALDYYECLNTCCQKIYLNMVISGVLFCDFTNDFMDFALSHMKPASKSDHTYDQLYEAWIKNDFEYHDGMPAFNPYHQFANEGIAMSELEPTEVEYTGCPIS